MGGVESPFFRGNLNLSGYSGFNTGLLHPGIGPPSTPFVPPNHLTSFTQKVRFNFPQETHTHTHLPKHSFGGGGGRCE